jgi:hypothetical protein
MSKVQLRCHKRLHLTGRQLGKLSLTSQTVSSSADLFTITVSLLNTLVFLANLLSNTARVADGSSVAVVGVDAGEVRLERVGADIGHNNVTRTTIVGTVATAAVEFADIDNSIVADSDSSTAIVLDDLIIGVLGSTTLNEDIAGPEGRDGI